LEALQGEFKRSGGSRISVSGNTSPPEGSTSDAADNNDPQGALIKQLLEAVLQFILQLLK